MADQWNDNIPAMGDQISADIPDIEENMGHMRSSFERIFETWSLTTGGNATSKFDSAVGFYDGTYNYEFPTNGVGADSVIMLGDSDTVVWMYLNTAPPGWKALATGADTVLAVAGGTEDYNVDGGNPDSSATWTIAGHLHQWYKYNGDDTDAQSYDSNGDAEYFSKVATTAGSVRLVEITDTTGKSGLNHDAYTTSASASDDAWRPSASVGKLFQLDTA